MGSRQVFVSDLVTVDDLATRWHMPVGRVSNLAKGKDGRRRISFPAPIAGRGSRGVWLWPVVDEWYRTKVRCDQTHEDRKQNYVCKPKH